MNQIPGGTRAQARGMSKEKKQLLVLGVLGVVLVGVVVVQFGGGGEEGASAASATPAVALAKPDANLPAAGPTDIVPAADNEALVAPGIGVRKNPFSEFWKSDEPVAEETAAPVVPPPSITVNGTLTSGKTPIAILDGQVRHIGDVVSGWTLVGIEQRSVRMRSPTGATKSYEMPLLPGGR